MLLIKMRALFVSILSAKLVVGTAMMARDMLEAPLEDPLGISEGLLYHLTSNTQEGTQCNVQGVKILRWF